MPEDELRRSITALLSVSRSVYPPNVFSAGARRYYENPTRDILMQFLDAGAELGMSDVVLSALLPQDHGPYGLLQSVESEVATDKGSRIDLLLTGTDYIAAVELKVFHSTTNPFHEYQAYVKARTPPGFSNVFILVAPDPRPPNVSSEWVHVSWKQFLATWEAQLTPSYVSDGLDQSSMRGYVLAKEFILHLRGVFDMNRIVPDLHELQAQSQHYYLAAQARKAVSMYEAAVAEAIESFVMKQYSEDRVTEWTVRHWGNGMTAFILRFEDWPSVRKDYEKVCLVLDPNEQGERRFFVRGYLDTDDTFRERRELHHLDEMLRRDGFVRTAEGKHCLYYTHPNADQGQFESLPAAAEGLVKLAKTVDEHLRQGALPAISARTP